MEDTDPEMGTDLEMGTATGMVGGEGIMADTVSIGEKQNIEKRGSWAGETKTGIGEG